jgi:UDP-N-acetylmuramyl pentapeptide phosphotransferase/UDP-N-acetylglucosamine-1-phosphate transferase
LVLLERRRAMSAISTIAIAIFTSWLALVFLRSPGRLPADRPNARSLHREPVPRGGGLAIWVGVLAATVWLSQPLPWLAPLLIVVVVSVWEDRSGVPVWLRLTAQIVAALWWLGWRDFGIGTLLTVFAVVWMANLYNFMDGSDGLAAAMAVVGFGAYAIVAGRAGAADALVSLAIVAATLPFLARNWPPARVFLGDVGAVPLGFMAALLGIAGARAGYWPAWFPVLVFLPFIGDATVTLLRRVKSGDNLLNAHRDHYYQRLVRLGLGHGGALALYLALMLGTAVSAIAALQRPPAIGRAVLALWILALLLLYTGIGYYWRRNQGLE